MLYDNTWHTLTDCRLFHSWRNKMKISVSLNVIHYLGQPFTFNWPPIFFHWDGPLAGHRSFWEPKHLRNDLGYIQEIFLSFTYKFIDNGKHLEFLNENFSLFCPLFFRETRLTLKRHHYQYNVFVRNSDWVEGTSNNLSSFPIAVSMSITLRLKLYDAKLLGVWWYLFSMIFSVPFLWHHTILRVAYGNFCLKKTAMKTVDSFRKIAWKEIKHGGELKFD